MAGTLLVAVVAFAHLLTVALTYPASDKIVGGWPAALGQYPYQVLYTTVHCRRHKFSDESQKAESRKPACLYL